MTKAGEILDIAVLKTLVGAPPQAGPVFAKIVDRARDVADVTWRGLAEEAHPGAGEQEIWAAFWAHFWTGPEATTAAGLVDCALGGKANEFLGQFQIDGDSSTWEVEALPLDWQDGTVRRVLILVTRHSAHVQLPVAPVQEAEGCDDMG